MQKLSAKLSKGAPLHLWKRGSRWLPRWPPWISTPESGFRRFDIFVQWYTNRKSLQQEKLKNDAAL